MVFVYLLEAVLFEVNDVSFSIFVISHSLYTASSYGSFSAILFAQKFHVFRIFLGLCISIFCVGNANCFLRLNTECIFRSLPY